MQRVIELARTIRERKKRPLKQPLQKLTVVHPESAVLSALTGELAEYIYQETNVRELITSNDPEQFGTVRAEPVFSVRFILRYKLRVRPELLRNFCQRKGFSRVSESIFTQQHLVSHSFIHFGGLKACTSPK